MIIKTKVDQVIGSKMKAGECLVRFWTQKQVICASRLAKLGHMTSILGIAHCEMCHIHETYNKQSIEFHH